MDTRVRSDLPLPVVDFTTLTAEPGCRSEIASNVRNALEEFGFFYLVGHQVDYNPLHEQLQSFFSLPSDDPVKTEATGKPGHGVAGYYPVESINTHTIFGKEGPPDCCQQFTWKESISQSDRDIDPFLSTAGDLGFKTNPKNPDVPKMMRRVLDRTYSAVDSVAKELFSLVCEAYGLQPGDYQPLFKSPNCSSLTYLHYPPPQNLHGWDSGRLRMAEHCDLDVLTLLHCNDAPGGLEVCPPGYERFFPVPAVPGAIIVNSGEILKFWSRGRIKATVHRVAMPPKDKAMESDRVSVAFSLLPRGDTNLVPFDAQMNYPGSTLAEFLGDVMKRYREEA